MSGQVAFALFIVIFTIGVMVGTRLDRIERGQQEQRLRTQLQAMAAALRLSEGAWYARQQLHQVAAEERRRQQEPGH